MQFFFFFFTFVGVEKFNNTWTYICKGWIWILPNNVAIAYMTPDFYSVMHL